jgi:hypothetical protein
MLLAILQAAGAATSEGTPFWPSLGVGGAIAILVITFWRLDRKESESRYKQLADESQTRYSALAGDSQERYERLATESQERYERLAKDFRSIVEDNTRAITSLGEKIGGIQSSDIATVRMLMEALKKNKVVNLEP